MLLLNFLAARASIETTLHLVVTRTTAHLNATNQTGAHAADVTNSVRVFVLLCCLFTHSFVHLSELDLVTRTRHPDAILTADLRPVVTTTAGWCTPGINAP